MGGTGQKLGKVAAAELRTDVGRHGSSEERDSPNRGSGGDDRRSNERGGSGNGEAGHADRSDLGIPGDSKAGGLSRPLSRCPGHGIQEQNVRDHAATREETFRAGQSGGP